LKIIARSWQNLQEPDRRKSRTVRAETEAVVVETRPSVPHARAALGVTAAATPAQVVTAFRRHARKVHPDVSQAQDASDQFAALVAAYHVALRAARGEPHVRIDLGAAGRSAASPHPAAARLADVTHLAGIFICEAGRPIMVVGPVRVEGSFVRPGPGNVPGGEP
jgi:hypothetical protein